MTDLILIATTNPNTQIVTCSVQYIEKMIRSLCSIEGIKMQKKKKILSMHIKKIPLK